MEKYSLLPISTATTTTPILGSIVVHTISFPKATAGTVTIKDGPGNTITILPVGSIGSLVLDVTLNGLSIVTASADSVLVAYTQ